MIRPLGSVVRDAEANALYLYIRTMAAERAQHDRDGSPSTLPVARTVELASHPTVLADFSADGRLVGIEILRPSRLRPLYLYRRPRSPRRHHPHRPHPGAPAGPGSRGDGVAGADAETEMEAGEGMGTEEMEPGRRLRGKVVRWRRGR